MKLKSYEASLCRLVKPLGARRGVFLFYGSESKSALMQMPTPRQTLYNPIM